MRNVDASQARHHYGSSPHRLAVQNELGFTLLELILATLISSLVMGILSVALTFSLRMWEREQNRQLDDAPAMVELLKLQLASTDNTPMKIGDQTRALFELEDNSFAFVTSHSVKALSKGAPVVARYIFDSGERKLYYSEIPFDPYHPAAIEEFLQIDPHRTDGWPRFYGIEVKEFSLVVNKQEKDEEFPGDGEGGSAIPEVVVLSWSRMTEDFVHTSVMRTDFFFPQDIEAPVVEKMGEGL